jgi:hypothetical protein
MLITMRRLRDIKTSITSENQKKTAILMLILFNMEQAFPTPLLYAGKVFCKY